MKKIRQHLQLYIGDKHESVNSNRVLIKTLLLFEDNKRLS